MPLCARCDKPIAGKPVTYDHISPSAGGTTVYLCPGVCTPVPHQTAPTRRVQHSRSSARRRFR
jgi:hypothetical protein